jgi:hypothetical protein
MSPYTRYLLREWAAGRHIPLVLKEALMARGLWPQMLLEFDDDHS